MGRGSKTLLIEFFNSVGVSQREQQSMVSNAKTYRSWIAQWKKKHKVIDLWET